MKKIFVVMSGILFAFSNASAASCPDLAGKYTCVDEFGSSSEISVKQQNGLFGGRTSYTVSGFISGIGLSDPIKFTAPLPLKQFPKYSQRAFCSPSEAGIEFIYQKNINGRMYEAHDIHRFKKSGPGKLRIGGEHFDAKGNRWQFVSSECRFRP